MAYDAATFSMKADIAPVAPMIRVPASLLIDSVAAPCPKWTAANPDRALAMLFVAPQDCEAVDVLVSL